MLTQEFYLNLNMQNNPSVVGGNFSCIVFPGLFFSSPVGCLRKERCLQHEGEKN